MPHSTNEIQTIGVAGLGLLGRGIAACCLAHNFHVVAYTRTDQTHQAAAAYIEHAIDDLIEHANFPDSLRNDWPARYHPVKDLNEFQPCQFVIETVLEDPDIKRKVFDTLESTLASDVVIASNTSALPITSLQADRKHPARFLGMHWAEPAHATRFCELIRGDHTSDAAFQTAESLAKRLGKEPSLVHKDVPAFIVNRIGYAMYREAFHIVEQGIADIETVDRSCRNALGLWATLCGPFRWMDLTGGPALYAKAMKGVLPSLSNRTDLPPTMRDRLSAGEQGLANGQGFYTYTQEDREHWDRLLLEHAWAVRKLQQKYHPLHSSLPTNPSDDPCD